MAWQRRATDPNGAGAINALLVLIAKPRVGREPTAQAVLAIDATARNGPPAYPLAWASEEAALTTAVRAWRSQSPLGPRGTIRDGLQKRDGVCAIPQ